MIFSFFLAMLNSVSVAGFNHLDKHRPHDFNLEPQLSLGSVLVRSADQHFQNHFSIRSTEPRDPSQAMDPDDGRLPNEKRQEN